MDYGKVISQLREKMNQTQVEFAKSIGITQTYLSQMEANLRTPSNRIIKKICSHTDTMMPIFLFKSITESDVDENKLEAFRLLNKPLTELIESHGL